MSGLLYKIIDTKIKYLQDNLLIYLTWVPLVSQVFLLYLMTYIKEDLYYSLLYDMFSVI